MSVRLGHFELLEQIGKGGMAAVFRAFDPSLKRHVAIKLLDEDLIEQDPQIVENFVREAQSAAGINHPNIVQIYFVGEEGGNYYIVMELLEGRTLEEVIRQCGPLEEDVVMKIGSKVAQALQAAYEQQMIHGDVKPQNIFITNNGTAKLLDFGLAKMMDVENTAPEDSSVWGSAYYISPERIGRKAEDFRSDIYSLGATLFHALTGRPPFDAETTEELAVKRLHEKAPSLRSINPTISKKTDRIIARMLEKNPFLRYLDYNALLADMHDAEVAPATGEAGEESSGRQAGKATTSMTPHPYATTAEVASVVASVPEDTVPEGPSKKPVLIGVAVAAAVVICGIAFFALKKPSTQPTASTPRPASSATPAAMAQASPVNKPSQTPRPGTSPAGMSSSSPSKPAQSAPSFHKIQATNFDSKAPAITVQPCSEGGQNLTSLTNNSFIGFFGVYMSGAKGFEFRVASGYPGEGLIEIHLTSQTGPLIGMARFKNTGGWDKWTSVSTNIGSISGIQNIYLVFKSADGNDKGVNLLNLSWFKLK